MLVMEVVVIEVRMLSGSAQCVAAIALKSMLGGDLCNDFNASATQLSVPLICWMSHVNCEMKYTCLSCLGVFLSECDCDAKISGLWLVNA